MSDRGSVVRFEDRQTHDEFCRQLMEAHAPAGAAETELAAAIAEDRWRVGRLRDVEYNLFAQGHQEGLAEAQTFMRHAKEFERLSLDESRIHRRLDKNTRQLTKMQAARRSAEAKALTQAARLADIAESKGESFDPAQRGFGFSADELNKHRDYARRLAEARKLLKAPAAEARKVIPIN